MNSHQSELGGPLGESNLFSLYFDNGYGVSKGNHGVFLHDGCIFKH
jgi:hypothetical protein